MKLLGQLLPASRLVRLQMARIGTGRIALLRLMRGETNWCKPLAFTDSVYRQDRMAPSFWHVCVSSAYSMAQVMKRAVVIALPFATIQANAQLVIKVDGQGTASYAVAVSKFSGGREAGQIADVLREDLGSSSCIRLVPPEGSQLDERLKPSNGESREPKADFLVVGGVTSAGQGVESRLRLHDVALASEIDAFAIVGNTSEWRRIGHALADRVYSKITGEPGVFSTRIAFVRKHEKVFSLVIVDADGKNAQVALESKAPITSVTWSPEGKRLAYVSLEQRKPLVYVHHLESGQRQVVANPKGGSYAPAWSPDGRSLALVLTQDGTSQIYTVNADGSMLQRLITSRSIDTEPKFSPDGRWIYFTSDRGSSPQVYRIASTGGEPERLTFDNTYNVSPQPSPDGKALVYLTRDGSGFRIGLLDLETKYRGTVPNSEHADSPSVAPNSRYIIYSSDAGGRRSLVKISIDGRNRSQLGTGEGEAISPAWSPSI